MSSERHTCSSIFSPADSGAGDILSKVGRTGARNIRLMWNHQVAEPDLTLKMMYPFKIELVWGEPWVALMVLLNTLLVGTLG